MPVLVTAKVGRDFRVTLPKEIRELLKLEEGDELIFYTMERRSGIKRVCIRK